MSFIYCCDEFFDYDSRTSNLQLAIYSPSKKSLTYTTHGKEWVFKFCPFCGVKLLPLEDK